MGETLQIEGKCISLMSDNICVYVLNRLLSDEKENLEAAVGDAELISERYYGDVLTVRGENISALERAIEVLTDGKPIDERKDKDGVNEQ